MSALSKERKNYLERATLQYHENLHEAEGWLAGRGIDLDHARSNVLGVVRNPLPGHEHLAGRLVIPYLTDFGPVNMNFRCIQGHTCKEIPDHEKYMFSKGSVTNLYGVQSIGYADEWIAVTEGEIDRLILTQIGIPAIAISGAKKWQSHWVNVFEDFSRVYLFEDGDDAGKSLWDKVSYELGNAIRVRMPTGEDVNSMYLKAGAEYLKGRIKK